MARPPSKENESLLKRYRGEVERSRKWREHENMDAHWQSLIDLYRGRQHDKVTHDTAIVNMAFATINVIAPSIAVNYPSITIHPRKPESSDQAVIAERVTNYHWRFGKFQPQFRLATNDMLMIGHGWLKVGWSKPKKPHPTVTDEDFDDKETLPPTNPDAELAADTERSTTVNDDRPFMERVSPFDMFVDPDATHPANVRWMCQRVRRHLYDVKCDQRYEAIARKQTEGTSGSKWDKNDSRWENTGAVESGYVDVFEFYDLIAGTISTFAANGDHFLIKPRPNPHPYGAPFEMLRDYEVPDQFYPMGELEAIEVLQRELNETRTQMLNHRKKYSPKWLYREDVFDDEGIRALQSDDYNVIVPVRDTGGASLSDVIIPMPTTMTPPEFYSQSQQITADIDMVSGVSDYMRGNMPEIRRTATEAAMLQDSQAARAADKLARIETHLAACAEKVVQAIQTFTAGEQVVRLVGQDGLQVFLPYDRQSVTGLFDFEVEAGSTQPRNETFRRQSAMQLTDALAPAIQAGIIDLAKLSSYQLQFGFGVNNPGDFLLQQAPPMEGEEGMDPMDPMAQQGVAAPEMAPQEAIDPQMMM